MKHYLRQSIRTLVFSVSLCSFILPASTFAVPTTNEDTALRAITTGQSQDYFVQNWIYNYEGDMMRANRDLKMAQVLRSNPLARNAYSALAGQLQSNVETQELALNTNASVASKNIDPDHSIRKIVKQMAQDEGFSQASINDAKVWTTFGSVNAYTFSPLYSHINVVIYQDLIDMMTEAQLHSVIAHELGHIRMKHVLSGMVMQTVFEATGQMLIKDPAEQLNFLSAVRSGTTELFREALDADGPVADRLVKEMMNVTQKAALQLAQNSKPNEIGKLADSLVASFGLESHFEQYASGGTAEMMNPIQMKVFKSAMTSVTRDQERTADRWAVLMRGPKEMASAMAVLAGGRNAKADAIQQQAQDLIQKAHELGVSLDSLDTNDHPTPVIRVAAALIFSQSTQYQIMADPFKKSVDQYLKLLLYTQNLTTQLNNNNHEQIEVNAIETELHALQKYSQTLSSHIAASVKAEVDSKTSMEKTKYLLKTLNAINSDFTNQYRTLVGPSALVAQVKHLAQSNVADPAWQIVNQNLDTIYPADPLAKVLGGLDALVVAPAVQCRKVFE